MATTGGVLASGPLQALLGNAALAKPRPEVLAEVADLRDGRVRLHLPRGFQYRSFHDTDVLAGSPPITLDDGTILPGRHDGMAAFPGRRTATSGWSATTRSTGPWRRRSDRGRPYDTSTGGGTTTILVTPRGEVVDAFTSLNGTQMNCSGGRMPWGSWITCEETVNGPDVGPDFTLARRTSTLTTAPRLHLRGAGRRAVQPGADHVGGSLRPRGGGVQPGRGHRLPHRGQLRLPVRALPLHPAGEPDGRRRPRTTAAGCRCCGSSAWPTPTSRRPRPTAPRTTSTGSTSPTRTRRSRSRRA